MPSRRVAYGPCKIADGTMKRPETPTRGTSRMDLPRMPAAPFGVPVAFFPLSGNAVAVSVAGTSQTRIQCLAATISIMHARRPVKPKPRGVPFWPKSGRSGAVLEQTRAAFSGMRLYLGRSSGTPSKMHRKASIKLSCTMPTAPSLSPEAIASMSAWWATGDRSAPSLFPPLNSRRRT